MAKLTVNRLNSTWTPLNNEEANYKVRLNDVLHVYPVPVLSLCSANTIRYEMLF